MTYVLTIIGMALLVVILASVYRDKNILSILILSLSSFIILYIINSAVLFYIDKFSVPATCAMVAAESLVICIILMLCGKRPAMHCSLIDAVIPGAIFLLMLPVVFGKFGFYGMGQDQGVYQTKAIALIEGYNQNVYELSETRDMNEDQKNEYVYGISEQYGFYTNPYNDEVITGVFHGINTYPAVLAWWGTMFGYANMTGVNTLLFLCGIVLIYGVARILSVSRAGAGVAAFLYAFSPIVLWVNKSTLSEAVTNVIFLLYLYFLLDRKNKKMVLLSSFAVVAFAVFHVSIYVIMPLFTIVYIAMYFLTGNKLYLVANIISAIGYKLGYIMMLHIAEGYTNGNYAFVQRLGVSAAKMPLLATIAVTFVVVISVAFMFVPVRRGNEQIAGDGLLSHTIFDYRWLQIGLAWLMRILVVLCALYAYRMTKHSVYSYVNATMYAFVAATAIVVIPFILFMVFFRAKTVFQNKILIPLYFIFLYCCIMYSTVFSPFVTYYNYYSRYISVYISTALLFGVCLLECVLTSVKQKRMTVKNRKIVVYGIVVAISLVLYTRYDIFMISHQDETRMQWSTVSEVSSQLKESDALIIDGELKNYLFYTTKYISKNRVYPVMTSLENTVSLAQKSSDQVYYVSYTPLTQEQQAYYHLDMVSETGNTEYLYDKDRVDVGKLPYVRTCNVNQRVLYLYKYNH